MIISVCLKIKDIYEQGRNFKWVKPDKCPRCSSCRIWGHGFVEAYFDGFYKCLFLRRFRCPDCACVMRMKPEGYFNRFRATTDTIRSCIYYRLLCGRWDSFILKSRQRHWLCSLKKKAMAFFGFGIDLITAFDWFVELRKIPVSRGT